MHPHLSTFINSHKIHGKCLKHMTNYDQQRRVFNHVDNHYGGFAQSPTLIRSQSNLAKAALNALHTLHVQECLASAIADTMGCKKSEVSYMTPRSYDLLLHICGYGPSICTQNFKYLVSIILAIAEGGPKM